MLVYCMLGISDELFYLTLGHGFGMQYDWRGVRMCNWMCVGMTILGGGGGGVCSGVALVGLMAGSVVELGEWLRAPAAASHFCHLRALLGERNPMKNTSNRV